MLWCSNVEPVTTYYPWEGLEKMKYDGHHLHLEYLLGKTMKVQALAIEAHKYDAIYSHFKNIILNICAFVK